MSTPKTSYTAKDMREAFVRGVSWGSADMIHPSHGERAALKIWPDPPPTVREVKDPACLSVRWRYIGGAFRVVEDGEIQSPEGYWFGMEKAVERMAILADLAARPYLNAAGEPIPAPTEE